MKAFLRTTVGETTDTTLTFITNRPKPEPSFRHFFISHGEVDQRQYSMRYESDSSHT